jgi:hypothetical protein
VTDQAGEHGPANSLAEALIHGVLAWRIITHLRDGEDVEATVGMLTLVKLGGAYGLYVACGAWADVIGTRMIGNNDGDVAFAGLEISRVDTGEQVDPNDLPDDMAPALWAGRFVAANYNKDDGTMQALFNAQLKAERLDGIDALAHMAAAAATPSTEDS